VLNLEGDQVFRSRIEFAGDVTLTFEGTLWGGEKSLLMVGVGQADGKGAILTSGMQSLSVVNFNDSKAAISSLKEEPFSFFQGNSYTYRISRRGDNIICSIDGEKTATGRYSGLNRGCVFLWCASDSTFLISELTLEGMVDPAWIEEEYQQALKNRVDTILGF
jgi:hypothetical protein